MADDPIAILRAQLPGVVRWAGAIARELRRHDIGLSGKSSGFADTDALTLADLTVQELLVAALRDMGPVVRRCRIEAEETTGDLGRFAEDGDWVLAIDPIDGTRMYRDRTGNGYAVMLHARTADTVRYSLLYFPEEGVAGTWLEARDDAIVLGPDNVECGARAALDALPPIPVGRRPESCRVWVGGFLERDPERARAVSATGLDGVLHDDIRGGVYAEMARGHLAGALVHTPNVYDFPVCIHIARLFGGDAVWVHDGRPVDFRALWRDERSSMLRLGGIVACAFDRQVLTTLVNAARNWSPERYDSSPPARP
jgi:3'(2'), 5'-bisphosphate nucleotidase